MSALLELADRCEAATGPDRGIDFAIVTTLCPDATVGKYIVGDGGDIVFHAETIGIPNKSVCPAYTASLDAAMTLVPEGWGWSVNQPNAKAIASGLLKENTPVMGEVQYGCEQRFAVACATPALALCAASLRARAALETGDAS